MNILVTGGKGFIASTYIKAIEKLGHKCRIFDLPENNITDSLALRIEILQCDMVLHFAAMADVTVCIKKWDETFETNIRGTYNIGKICAEEDKKLIFISTCCIYGNSLDIEEIEWKTAPMCSEPYAVSKVAGEYILRGIPNLQYVFLRIGTIYGVGMREALFTYIALDRIRRKEPVYIDGDGKQTRQLLFIDELVDGITKATEKFNDIKGEIINLCGIEKTSAEDTVDVAAKIIGLPPIKIYREQRYGQTFEENISIQKAADLLGWSPTMNFYDGMKYTYENDSRFKN